MTIVDGRGRRWRVDERQIGHCVVCGWEWPVYDDDVLLDLNEHMCTPPIV